MNELAGLLGYYKKIHRHKIDDKSLAMVGFIRHLRENGIKWNMVFLTIMRLISWKIACYVPKNVGRTGSGEQKEFVVPMRG